MKHWQEQELRGGTRERSESLSSSSSIISYSSGSSSDYSPREFMGDDDDWIPASHSPRMDYNAGEDDYERDSRHYLEAAEYGYLNRVKRLLGKHSVNIDSTDAAKESALMKAAKQANLDVLRFLLRHRVEVNATDRDGRTALIFAADNGKVSAVQLLLAKRHVCVDQRTREGKTALMLAAQKGYIRVLQCLLEAGADLNACAIRDKFRDGHHGRRSSSIYRSTSLTQPPYKNSPTFDNPILLAVENGHLKAVQLLMAAGANLDSPRQESSRLLFSAAASGRLQVVQCLIEIGVDVNAAGRNGQTALMRAVEADHTEIVRTLLENGADIRARDMKEQTAMSIAVDKGRLQIQTLLIQYEPWTLDGTQTSNLRDGDQPTWAILPANVELRDGANVGTYDNGTVGIGEISAKWLDADVVVKLFVPEASSTNFRESVAQWHQLRHPNVIKLYGACDIGPNFFVCEHARSGSVTEYLAANYPRYQTPWKFLHEAALGLLYLHARNIFHGNLRCSNILISSDGQAKLTNFAVSGSITIGQAPNSNIFLGHVRWQSPERLLGSPPSFASDVYSLGMCILELISGDVPWRYESREDSLIKKISKEGIQYLGQPRDIKAEEWSLIKRMCAYSPEERIPVSTVTDTLELFAAKEKDSPAQRQPESEKRDADSRDWKQIGLIDEDRLYDLDDLVKTELDRYTLNDFKSLREILNSSKTHSTVIHRYNDVFLEFGAAVRVYSRQEQAKRLMGTRTSILTAQKIHRRVGILWEAVTQLQNTRVEREENWQQACAQHFDAFVQKVLKVCESPSRQQRLLKTEDDWSTFLGFLRDEIDRHANDYTKDQLSTITQECETIADKAQMTAMLPVTPSYYIPKSELQDYLSARDLGEGSFGRVRTIKWLDSEVVVKELMIDGKVESSSSSRWAMSASKSMGSTGVAMPESQERQEQRGEALRIFRRELEIWYGLSHPHVVRLFGACHVGAPFFVCEYAKHGTLVDYLGKRPDQIWPKLYEAALGIQYLHERHITHGDLKGNNIVIGDEEQAKVTDFGLSSVMDSEERAQISGAVQWVAPECLGADRKNPSPKSDVFSFGMCIIEALHVVEKKEPSYPWGNIPDTAVKFQVKKLQKLPRMPSQCSETQLGLVRRMCEFDPNKRIEIIAVVDELEKLAKGSLRGRDNATEHSTQAVGVLTGRDVSISVVSEMQQMTASGFNSDVTHKLANTFGKFWNRIARVVPIADVEEDALWCDSEFQEIIADAAGCTKCALAKPCRTLVLFTELTLRSNSLHRRLDKLIASKRLSPHADSMIDLDWRDV